MEEGEKGRQAVTGKRAQAIISFFIEGTFSIR